MAVSVSRDLSVRVTADVNEDKLQDKQLALRSNIQRGDPRAMGVSQMMVGLMVMSYSIPLHFTELTEVINLAVPWWSGLSFLAAGVVAIVMEKHCSIKTLTACLAVTAASMLLAVVALIVYSIDLQRNPESDCNYGQETEHCDNKHYATSLSRGIKSSLLLFTVVQTVISSTLCFLLYRERRAFRQYTSLTQTVPATPTTVTPPDFN